MACFVPPVRIVAVDVESQGGRTIIAPRNLDVVAETLNTVPDQLFAECSGFWHVERACVARAFRSLVLAVPSFKTPAELLVVKIRLPNRWSPAVPGEFGSLHEHDSLV